MRRQGGFRDLVERVAALLLPGLLALAGCLGDSRSRATVVESGGLEIRAAVAPPAPRVGENRLWLELRDSDGNPVEQAQWEARVHMHAMGAMPAMGGPARVREVGGGRYEADFELEMGGTWRVEIRARTSAGAVARAEGSLTAGTPGLRLAASGSAGTEGSAEPAPETALQEEHPGEFRIDPRRLQQVGVRTTAVERRPFETTIRAVGRVSYDETALHDVSLKVRGWVSELRVDAVGDPVERGQVLFTLYSPELYAAQEEYLQAVRSRARAQDTGQPHRADYLVDSAAKRLRLWDVGPGDLQRLAARGVPTDDLPIRSPVSGYVVEKNVVAGSGLEPGQRLYRIAPLDRVWIEAEVYESELGLVRQGQAAEITLPYLPDRRYEGEVAYVYPELSGDTRTARLRIVLPNPSLDLRPAMWTTVRLRIDHGERLVVPQSAVLYAGDRSFAFLDLGDGRFRPQEVEVGLRSGDWVEVRAGLEAGARVVTSGTFLIASESRLRAALEQW